MARFNRLNRNKNTQKHNTFNEQCHLLYKIKYKDCGVSYVGSKDRRPE